MATQHTFTFMGTGGRMRRAGVLLRLPRLQRGAPATRAHGAATAASWCAAERDGSVLIDTPPDLRHQLLREDVRTVDRLLYTHAHFDHLGGLGELEYLVQLVSKAALAHATAAPTRSTA